jgi:predicted nucleic acid-binding protein
MRYFDSGLLLKLYFSEPNSERAVALVGTLLRPLTGLHRVEMKAAFAQKVGRGEITVAERDRLLAQLASDLVAGAFRPVSSAWDDVFAQAEVMADDFGAATLCRSLDILHVALALEMGATEFCTFDQRQAAMATAVGLQVVS